MFFGSLEYLYNWGSLLGFTIHPQNKISKTIRNSFKNFIKFLKKISILKFSKKQGLEKPFFSRFYEI